GPDPLPRGIARRADRRREAEARRLPRHRRDLEELLHRIMTTESIPGLRWMENGQCSLSGNLLELERSLERVFLGWAAEERAAEHRSPTSLPAKELGKLDYFRSFAHLVTFPVALDAEKENLESFVRGEPLSKDGEIRLTRAAPIQDVLTPAACYHFYV